MLIGTVLLKPSTLYAEYENELIVRTVTNLKTLDDVNTLVSLCQQNDIAIISVAFKQDEDDEIRSGEVFYPSSIAPIAEGYEEIDILKVLIDKAHKKDIKVNAWIPQFHDQVAYAKDPEWGMMTYHEGKTVSVHEKNSEYFVNPLHEDVQAYELSIIEEVVSMYDVDAVVLDWIRFDGFNMDLSDYTRKKYKYLYGYDPILIDFSKENILRAEWNDFRTDVIAEYIKEVRKRIEAIKPSLDIGVYTLSPAWHEVGQDPEKFHEDIDFISPMSYYDDWGYPIDWIYGPRSDSILLMTDDKVEDTAIVPVFDTNWKDEIYQDIFKNLKKSYPDIERLSWFEYGKWSEESIKRISALKDLE